MDDLQGISHNVTNSRHFQLGLFYDGVHSNGLKSRGGWVLQEISSL